MTNKLLFWIALLATLLFVIVSKGSGQVPVVSSQPEKVRVFFVSDIIQQGREYIAEQTGRQMQQLYRDNPDSIILGGGDLCNDNGSPECLDRLEHTSWGPLLPMMYAVSGNHEYDLYPLLLGRIPEFFFRFPRAGQAGLGWLKVGSAALERVRWVILGYNTELNRRDRDTNKFIDPNKALGQWAWLENQLRQNHKNNCVLTFGHRPTFSSFRPPGSNSTHDPYAMVEFQMFYQYGVDLNLAGHLHGVNWVPPLNPSGELDRNGVPTLITAAGGAVFFIDPRKDPALPSVKRKLKWGDDAGEQLLANTPGIGQVDLSQGSFTWKFLPTEPKVEERYPEGSGECHPSPLGFIAPSIN